MKNRRKYLFIFDIDGTLLYSGGAGTRSVDRAFEDCFLIKNASKGINFIGATDKSIFREICRKKLDIKITDEILKKLKKSYLLHLKSEVYSSEGFKVYEGVFDFLDYLKSRNDIMLGIATGNMKQGAFIKLERAGLIDYFEIGAFDENGCERFQIIKHALKRAEEKNKGGFLKVFYIGDSEKDVFAAKKAGIYSIAVGTSGLEKDGLKHNPDFYIKNMKNISFLSKIIV